MLLVMAFRNIFRQKKRTALTLITIILGIFLAIVGDGLNSGLRWQLSDIYIKTDTSNFKIYGKGFYNDEENRNPLEYLIKDDSEVDKILKDEESVKAYSKRLVFNGSLTNGVYELRAKCIGIDPVAEERVFLRSQYISAGEFIKGTNNEEEVVIGKEIAENLGLKTGDMITLSGRTKDNAINAYDVKIKGIIKTGNPIMDSSAVFMGLRFAQKFVDTDKINDVAVSTKEKSTVKLQPFINKLSKKTGGGNIECVGWFDETKDLLSLVDFREKIFSLITLAILIMASAGIANTMLMAMLERKKEIGVMMANGMEKKDVLKLFLSEGLVLGIIGSGIALIAGMVIVYHFQIEGIKIPASKEQLGDEFPVSEKFYMYLDYGKALFYFFIGIAVSGLAAYYPAKKATKLEPVEAMKG